MTDVILDIETIPDLEFGRQHMNLDGLADEDIIRAMTFRFLQQSGSEFPPLNMHKIITISFLSVSDESISMNTFSIDDQSEKEMLQSFHEKLDDASRLISWNGLRFDIPVIQIRSMLYELNAAEPVLSMKKNLDLKHQLSMGQTDKIQGLGTLSKQMGSTGKLLDSGKKVWDLFENKSFAEINQYCESDVINTYLVHLNYQILTQEIDFNEKKKKLQALIEYIRGYNPDHLAMLERSLGYNETN